MIRDFILEYPVQAIILVTVLLFIISVLSVRKDWSKLGAALRAKTDKAQKEGLKKHPNLYRHYTGYLYEYIGEMEGRLASSSEPKLIVYRSCGTGIVYLTTRREFFEMDYFHLEDEALTSTWTPKKRSQVSSSQKTKKAVGTQLQQTASR